MRDFAHDLGPVPSLAPAARTATANGTGVDLLGHGAAAVLAGFGAWTDVAAIDQARVRGP